MPAPVSTLLFIGICGQCDRDLRPRAHAQPDRSVTLAGLPSTCSAEEPMKLLQPCACSPLRLGRNAATARRSRLQRIDPRACSRPSSAGRFGTRTAVGTQGPGRGSSGPRMARRELAAWGRIAAEAVRGPVYRPAGRQRIQTAVRRPTSRGLPARRGAEQAGDRMTAHYDRCQRRDDRRPTPPVPSTIQRHGDGWSCQRLKTVAGDRRLPGRGGGEEQGLIGSQHLYAAEGRGVDVIAMVSVDMPEQRGQTACATRPTRACSAKAWGERGEAQKSCAWRGKRDDGPAAVALLQRVGELYARASSKVMLRGPHRGAAINSFRARASRAAPYEAGRTTGPAQTPRTEGGSATRRALPVRRRLRAASARRGAAIASLSTAPAPPQSHAGGAVSPDAKLRWKLPGPRIGRGSVPPPRTRWSGKCASLGSPEVTLPSVTTDTGLRGATADAAGTSRSRRRRPPWE